MGAPRGSLQQRFWAKVNKVGPIQPNMTTRCWTWTDHVNEDGYGKIHSGKDKVYTMKSAHRVSWLLHFGSLPQKPICVLHKCDNPTCVNPDHLYLGTQKDNAKDRNSRGHGHIPKGIKNGRAKLSEDDVRAIRQRYEYRKFSFQKLADLYGVSTTMINDIVYYRSWKHIK